LAAAEAAAGRRSEVGGDAAKVKTLAFHEGVIHPDMKKRRNVMK